MPPTSEPTPSAPPALVVLAAGRSTRFGRPKHLEPVGPSGETLVDYVLFDAVRAGCRKAVFVVRAETRRQIEPRAREVLAGSGVPVLFALQRMDDLPGGRTPPPGRERPWGTGHAVLAASDHLDGGFLVANTDDFYWPEAYRALVAELGGPGSADPSAEPAVGAVAAYTLEDTLTGSERASRAVLDVGPDGFLTGVTEGRELRREGRSIVGRTLDGGALSLTGAEPVSMNLWALGRSVLPLLRAEMAAFLDQHADDPDAEFLLSEALDSLVRAGHARIRVLPVTRAGFGITFPSDVAAVRSALREAVAAEGYPGDLGGALAVHPADRRPRSEEAP